MVYLFPPNELVPQIRLTFLVELDPPVVAYNISIFGYYLGVWQKPAQSSSQSMCKINLMKLFEFEGKELFQKFGLPLPPSQLIHSLKELKKIDMPFPLMVKPQTLSGKRGRRGLIGTANNELELQKAVSRWLHQTIDGERIESILLETKVDIKKEYYLSITYSTKVGGPVVVVSDEGGIEIESQKPKVIPLDPLSPELPNLKHGQHFQQIFEKLHTCFIDSDLFLAEINPLVKTVSGPYLALDAKVITDDAAEFRRQISFPERNLLGRSKSLNEKKAYEIDATDHRGVVGRVYLELAGNIGVLAAGGGASLVAMDALVAYGGKPANYTEFSGNPPAEKVNQLTQIVLNRPSLKGCFLVGGKANFTDQFETLKGFIEGVLSLSPTPTYPIVIRRDGPRLKEAFAYLKLQAEKYHLDLTLLDSSTSIIEAAKIMVQKSEQYTL